MSISVNLCSLIKEVFRHEILIRGIPILKIQLFSRMFAKFGNSDILFSDKECHEYRHFGLFYEILKEQFTPVFCI